MKPMKLQLATFLHKLKAIENGEDDDAEKIIKENCKKDKKFVDTQDSRESELDRRFQYKYRKHVRTGYTLLHYAVIYNNKKIIEVLLEHNASKY